MSLPTREGGRKEAGTGRGKEEPQNAHGHGPFGHTPSQEASFGPRTNNTQRQGTDIRVSLDLPSTASPRKPSCISQAQVEASSGILQPLGFPNTKLICSAHLHSFIQQVSVEHSRLNAKCQEQSRK